MKRLIREMWQVKGKPHGMAKQQTQAFPPQILKFANGGHTSQNQERGVDGGEKCPVGSLVFHRERWALPGPGLRRTRGMDALALLPPSGLLVPTPITHTGSNQQHPRRQGMSLQQPGGVSWDTAKQGRRDSQ